MSLIYKMMKIVENAHRGQFRKYSDLPYYIHSFRVAFRIRDEGFYDESLICAVTWT